VGKGAGERYLCPFCEKPQPYFVYRRSKREWVTCPGCGKHIRKKDIPSRFVKVITEENDVGGVGPVEGHHPFAFILRNRLGYLSFGRSALSRILG